MRVVLLIVLVASSSVAAPKVVPSQDRTTDVALRGELVKVIRAEDTAIRTLAARPDLAWKHLVAFAKQRGKTLPDVPPGPDTEAFAIAELKDHAVIPANPDIRRILVRGDRALLVEHRVSPDGPVLIRAAFSRDRAKGWVLGKGLILHLATSRPAAVSVAIALRTHDEMRSVYHRRELDPLLAGTTQLFVSHIDGRDVRLRINGRPVYILRDRFDVKHMLYEEKLADRTPLASDPVFADRFCLRSGKNTFEIEAAPGEWKSLEIRTSFQGRPVVTFEIGRAGGKATATFDLRATPDAGYEIRLPN